MQAVHQDHPDLSVVLRMSLSLWTALLTQPPNLPAAVGCLLGDSRVARQGIMVRWSVWSGALLFDILHSHKRLSGSATPVTRGDTVYMVYMPVASRWGEDTPTCSPADPAWLVKSWWVVCVGVAVADLCFQSSGAVTALVGSSLWALSPEPIWLWSIPTITDTWQTAAHSSSGLSGQSTCVCTAWGQLKATRIHSNSCFNPPHCRLLSLLLCHSGFQRNEILLLINDG